MRYHVLSWNAAQDFIDKHNGSRAVLVRRSTSDRVTDCAAEDERLESPNVDSCSVLDAYYETVAGQDGLTGERLQVHANLTKE